MLELEERRLIAVGKSGPNYKVDQLVISPFWMRFQGLKHRDTVYTVLTDTALLVFKDKEVAQKYFNKIKRKGRG